MVERKSPQPNPEKGAALKKLLLEKLGKGDKTPIKKIESVSGDGSVSAAYYDFVPYVFEPEHQYKNTEKGTVPICAFEGEADPNASYKEKVGSGVREPATSTQNPEGYRATVFPDGVVDFEL